MSNITAYSHLPSRNGYHGMNNFHHDMLIPYISQNKKMNGLSKHKRSSKKKNKEKFKFPVFANVYNTKFELIKHTLESLDFEIQEEENTKMSYLIWTDSFISQDKLSELKSHQRINHFLGMAEISRKDFCAKKISKIQKVRPNDYQFFPKTWLFPQERNVFQKYIKETREPKNKKYFIMKPANGAMGIGIKLFSEDENIAKLPTSDSCIVQEYIQNPYLLDGYKNDLRIYVLITCCDPLRVYIYKEGLVRLGTEKYSTAYDFKSDDHFMHLTNYSVNKKSSNYKKVQEEFAGSKRSLSYFMKFLRDKRKVNTDELWAEIEDVIMKTLLLVQPHLIHNYKMSRPGQLPVIESVCFEILGFDILIDEDLKPWLIEVNRSPSFGMDESLDVKVKGNLLEDSIRLLNIKKSDKARIISFQKQRANKRLTLAAIKSRIDTQLTNEFLKKRRDIDRKKQDLIDQLIKSKAHSAREYYENRNIGHFKRIFPPEDSELQKKYQSLLMETFTLFNQLSSNNNSSNLANQNSANNNSITSGQNSDMTQLTIQVDQTCQWKIPREDEFVDLIKTCENEENLILTKFNIPPNSEQTTLIPIVDFYESSSDESESDSSSSDSSSSSGSSEQSKPSQIREKQKLRINSSASEKSSNNKMSLSRLSTPQLKNKEKEKEMLPKRPSSVTVKKSSEPSKGNKEKMLKTKERKQTSVDSKAPRNQSNIKPDNTSNSKYPINEKAEEFIESRNKHNVIAPDIYNELLKIMHTSLIELTIRYPGKEESFTKALLQKIQSNWEIHRKSIANYWLVSLNAKKRQKVIAIVKNNVDSLMEQNFQFASDFCGTRLKRLFDKIYNRLLWNRGHGLIQCFSNSKSWKIIFSSHEDQLRTQEVEICSRLVQLCLDSVLIVHHYSLQLAESVPGSITNALASPTVFMSSPQSTRADTPTSVFLRTNTTNKKQPVLSEATTASISIIPQL